VENFVQLVMTTTDQSTSKFMQTYPTTLITSDETDDENNLATSGVEEDTEMPQTDILEPEPPVGEPETPPPPPVTGLGEETDEEAVERDALEDERRRRLPAIESPNLSGIGSTVPL
jgi:hypothetical protein